MGCDLDEVFAYNTFKVVRVKDRYLGMLRLLLILGIGIYIIINVLIVNKGYNATEIPVGTVRSSLKMPASAINRAELGYCQGKDWDFPKENFKCAIWDEHYVRYPTEEINGLFITSRIQETSQTYQCGITDTDEACQAPFIDEDEPETKFIAGIEFYTVGLQHSFRSPTFSQESNSKVYQGSSNAYAGRIVDKDGTVIGTFPADTTSDKPDVLTLATLLQAAGADLSNPSNDPNNSQRYSGIVLVVSIDYTNADTSSTTHYTYRVTAIPNADYKIFEVATGISGDAASRTATRRLTKRAGPKVIFVVSGEMVKFDFQVLLVQLVSAMGLLSVATIIVEMLMLYVMPLRKRYSEAKFEETIDFSTLRDTEEAALNNRANCDSDPVNYTSM